jgi:hypothetical protein
LTELSLALAPVAHFPWGLHLHDLRRTGILTEVLAGVGEGGCELEIRRQTQGTLAWSRVQCGAPSAPILRPMMASVSPLPQRSDG